MRTLSLKLTGVSPLLMHNGQTADPLNPFAKAMKQVSGKKKKTEADFLELAKIEFNAGLYLSDDKKSVVLPTWVLEATLLGGAKKVKSGQACKAGLFIDNDSILHYDGETSPENLWATSAHVLKTGVRVGMSRVMRTRPMFRNWSCVVDISYSDELLNPNDIFEFAQHAGQSVGLCDWRPKFGRFTAQKI